MEFHQQQYKIMDVDVELVELVKCLVINVVEFLSQLVVVQHIHIIIVLQLALVLIMVM
mgnify:CR=1 FL=1